MDHLANYRITLEVLTNWITILGVPIAIYLYWQEKKKERKEREYGTYNALDDKYIDFLNLCLSHSDLNISQLANVPVYKLEDNQKIKQQMIFEILTSILERAYLMYKEQSSEIRKDQWNGWELYINDWMANNMDYRSFWDGMSSQWDSKFTAYMNEQHKKYDT